MGTGKTILYSTALHEGVLVRVEKALKGETYQCPICKGEMILRQGTHRKPHFAHKALTENCTPESALHYGFKRLLAEKIEEHISSQQPLLISWSCNYCLEEHVGNLVKKTKRVEMEYNLGSCKPDIALLDSHNRVIAVIEVVVTHYPEEQALSYYMQNKIGTVIFQLQSENDLNRINELMYPNRVDSCLNPHCPHCQGRTNKKTLTIVESHCRRCQHSMLVTGLLSKGCLCGSFYPSDLELAQKKGVEIGYWQSNRSSWYYPTSSCPHCKGVIGLPWLWDQHINPKLDLPAQHYEAGFVCEDCDRDLNGQRQVRHK
ncbi:competence protein CoiA family protein [Leptothoe sp. PORK10 BA2]|uniref:competence protein CoiA family protein n=1 Tax=Leptothoe sp. PORK10 BA2 TaxID=3110254 RepID=UPI002B203110|nr:competence protein CoiA family protein [Leptothoe sp. PORK10 BA2]MEA5467202.1 competence protein CoiA family protein [Leptothoe sp. PORK10 BA2]